MGNPGVAAESNTIRIGDGSIHTSAFIAGVQVVPPAALGLYTNTNSVIIPTQSEVTVIATCDAGDVATGGGYECDLLNPILSTTDPRFSAPEGENGWGLEGKSPAKRRGEMKNNSCWCAGLSPVVMIVAAISIPLRSRQRYTR